MTDSESLLDEFDDLDALPASVDRAAVRRMRTVAYVLDDGIAIPGTDRRIGIDPLVGAVPVVGDAVTGALSLYLVVESARLGVSYTTLLRMMGNIAIDVAGGALPLVGDVFDAVWKANKRNLRLVLSDLAQSDREREAGTEIEIE